MRKRSATSAEVMRISSLPLARFTLCVSMPRVQGRIEVGFFLTRVEGKLTAPNDGVNDVRFALKLGSFTSPELAPSVPNAIA
jgi:hypothetical protein